MDALAPFEVKGQQTRVSRSRTSTLSTRSQKRSSTNQHFGITRTCTHLIMLLVRLMRPVAEPCGLV